MILYNIFAIKETVLTEKVFKEKKVRKTLALSFLVEYDCSLNEFER